MGTFLAAVGVVHAEQAAVRESIARFAADQGGSLTPRAGSPGDHEIGVLAGEGPNATFLCPAEFYAWDELALHVSRDLQTAAFSFHIHDGDMWMFTLFDRGELATRFNPIPDYWGELEPDERASWAGDAAAVCRCVPGASPSVIDSYLVEWSEDQPRMEQLAQPDDQFPCGVDWQLTDFMRRLGLPFPLTDDGSAAGETLALKVVS